MIMAISDKYLDYIIDQLSMFGEVETKRMFGGIGIFREGTMFAMIGKDRFRMRADDQNRGDYESYGMKAFMSTAKKKGLPYFEVPVEILEHKDLLTKWASESYYAALRGKK